MGRLGTQTVSDASSPLTVTTTWEYDSFNREITRTIHQKDGIKLALSQIWLKNSLLAARILQKDGLPIRKEEYAYDSCNRLIGYKVSGSSLPQDPYGHPMTGQSYNYDALNNLTCVKTMLAGGNTDTATYHYGNRNDPTQLSAVIHTCAGYPERINLRYDAQGRLIRDEAGRTLAYDALGRLRSVSGKNGSCAYSYDALNRLITQNIAGQDVRQLYYRGTELVAEITASPPHEIRLVKNGHTCFGVSDNGIYKPMAVDRNGSLLWSAAQDKIAAQVHAWSSYGGIPQDRLPGFNGERADPLTGMYHLGNGYRAYNPVLMRFNCPDSLSPFDAGGINPYAYCAGDPVNHTDPSGHMSWQAAAGITAGVIGLCAAVFTAGASIAAAGSISAALSAASASSLMIGALGVVSDITAIASGVMEDTYPHESAMLGWVSLGTGMMGGIVATGSVACRLAARKSIQNIPKLNHGSIRLTDNIAGKGPVWHAIEHNGKMIYGSDRKIVGCHIATPLPHIARRLSTRGPSPKPVVILSGTHGYRYGDNWARSGQRLKELLQRNFYLQDVRYFYRVEKNKRMVIVFDSMSMTKNHYQKIYENPICHVIGGYCYSRNDKALTELLQLPSIIS